MQDQDESRRDAFNRIDPIRLENTEDLELAFILQNSAPNDPALLKRLIDRYTKDLFTWVAALLYYQRKVEPTHQEILDILQQVYLRGISHVDQFHGQASVFTWLFALSYQVVKSHSFKDWVKHHLQKSRHQDELSNGPGAIVWNSLGDLSEQLRTPIILRQLFNLGLADIACILDLQVSEVHQHLVGARKRLHAGSYVPYMDRLIQDYVDGLLDDDPDTLSLFQQHLETCTECQSSVNAINNYEKSLAISLKQRWSSSTLDDDDLFHINQSVVSQIQLQNISWKPRVRLGQAVWMAGLLTVFVVLAIVFILMTPAEKEFPQADVAATTELPPIINIPPETVSIQSANSNPDVPQYIDTAFSSDGNTIVYASVKVDPATRLNMQPTIEIYDRKSDSINVISQGTDTLHLPLVWWDLAPSISGNGQYVVYVNATDNHFVTGSPCKTPDGYACLDIILYDREISTSRRLTGAEGAGAADGDSFAPTISEDGRWVVFWSAADNLVEGETEVCQPFATRFRCLYIYLFDLGTQKMERLPIREVPGQDIFGVDRISLSADGRYIGFTARPDLQDNTISVEGSTASRAKTATPTTVISPALPVISHNREAIIYDRRTGTYELENQAQDGTPGNGDSASPVLSADGRYVAFVSNSYNLVDQITSDRYNIFLRDRSDGKIIQVSTNRDGLPGNNDSGAAMGTWGYYMLNISSDGRYVVFESYATDLGQELSGGCVHYLSSLCSMLYVYDTQTDETEWINAASNGDYSLFPAISDDGRWVSFMQATVNCRPTNVQCSNVMLYDRQRGWLINLTRYEKETATFPWVNKTSLTIPSEKWESCALAISADGKLMALGGNDSKIRIWYIPNGIKSINQDNPDMILDSAKNDSFTALAIWQESGWLVAGTANGVVYVWDMSDGRILYTLMDQLDPIKKIAISQDDSHITISTLYETVIWTIGDKQLIKYNSISYGPTAVYALDIAPGGVMLATARGDGTVWLQDLPSGKVIGRLGGQQVTVNTLAFSQDGTMLAALSGQGIINIWKMVENEQGVPTFTFIKSVEPNIYITGLAFSPDNKYLATDGTIGEINMWSIPDATINIISPSVPNSMLYSLAFSPAGDVMATVFENEIVLWGVPPHVSSYYTHATNDAFVDSTPLPPSTANDIPHYGGLASSNGTVSRTLDQLAAISGSILFVPSHLPESIKFLDATVYEDGSLWLRYVTYYQSSYSALFNIYEKIIGWSPTPTMTIGASATIIPIRLDVGITQVNAEYVQGDWQNYTGFIPGEDPYTTQYKDIWQWNNSLSSQRLRWQQSGILIAIYYQVNQSYIPVLTNPGQSSHTGIMRSLLNQDDILQIASGMIWYNSVDTGLAYNAFGEAGVNATCSGGSTGCGEFYSPTTEIKHHFIFSGEIATE